MAQHDHDIANASGAAVRADLNLLFAAIASNNSGATAPSTTFANMWWFDTANNLLKQRDEANTAWITVAEKDATNWKPYWNTGLLSATFLEQANAVGQQTIWVPASAMTPTIGFGPANGSFVTSVNTVQVETLDFDASINESAQFFIQMPKSWNRGTLIWEYIWSHPSTTVNFGVMLSLQALALNNGDPIDGTFGATVTIADTGGTTDDLFISDEGAVLTVGGSPTAEELVMFKLRREATNGADTLAVDARLHGVKIHYTTDAVTDD